MTLSGRYELQEVLGEGVSATVHRALDMHTGSVVAVKILNPHLTTDEISIERFRREIQITRFLAHPQIVSIYDLVVEREHIYLVMQHVRGVDLKRFIAVHDPLDVDAVLDVLAQILRILALCHAKNVIHRDLKPQNVMVGDDRTVTLLDFGISRMTTLTDLTRTGTSLGSPEYMAPELFGASTYDPRTDLYALGVILFELLTGTLPFTGDTLPVLCRQHHEAPPPAIAAHRTDVPAWLQHLVEKLLAKDAHQRYQSADEVLWDLERKSVTSRRLPSLERRECLACGAATVAELPFCTLCGHEPGRGPAQGAYDVWCAGTVEPKVLESYLRTVFGPNAPAVRRAAGLVVAAVDRDSAELLRQSALRHGIQLAVRPRSIFALAKKLFSLAGLAIAAITAAHAFARSTQPYPEELRQLWMQTGEGLPPHTAYLLTVIRGAVFLALAWFCFGVFRRETVRPVLRDPSALRRHLGDSSGWLRELLPAAGRPRSESMQRLLIHLIEKYLLLARGGVPQPEVENGLRQLLRGAAEIATAAGEMEGRLEAAGLAPLMSSYAALADPLEGDAGGEREDLERRRRELGAQLAELSALEDAHAALVNKLVHVHSVFNRLLGKALALRLPLEQADAELLADCLRTLGDDVGIARQVRAELARVA